MLGRIPAFQTDDPSSISAGVGEFNPYPGTGCVYFVLYPMLSPECLCYSWEKRNLKFFLIWTALNFKGRSKTKIWARIICKRTQYIEFEREWSVDLGSTLGDLKNKKKTFFQFEEFFREKPIVPCSWVSNVLLIHKFNQNR